MNFISVSVSVWKFSYRCMISVRYRYHTDRDRIEERCPMAVSLIGKKFENMCHLSTLKFYRGIRCLAIKMPRYVILKWQKYPQYVTNCLDDSRKASWKFLPLLPLSSTPLNLLLPPPTHVRPPTSIWARNSRKSFEHEFQYNAIGGLIQETKFP